MPSAKPNRALVVHGRRHHTLSSSPPRPLSRLPLRLPAASAVQSVLHAPSTPFPHLCLPHLGSTLSLSLPWRLLVPLCTPCIYPRSMSKIPSSFLPSLLLLWPLQRAYAANFTFAYSAATQCGNFQISWQGMSRANPLALPLSTTCLLGGVAPFQLTLVPVRPSHIQLRALRTKAF